MRVHLPVPPRGSVKFLFDLVSRLTNAFRKIKPASGWKEIIFNLTRAQATHTNSPDWSVFRDGLYSCKFDPAVEDEVQLSFHLPHDMALSYKDENGDAISPIFYPHVHFSSSAATPNTGSVVWGFEWIYSNGYGVDTFGSSSTSTVTQTCTNVQYQHQVAELSNGITGDFECAGVIVMRFYRDATNVADTCTDGLHVFSVNLHYLSDGLLTTERNRGAGTVPWRKQNQV